MNWVVLHSDDQPLPLASKADAEGLVALGGRLTVNRLDEAYRKGIFPWYDEGGPVMWWSPDPRMVLYPEALHIPKSMQPLLSRRAFRITVDQCFDRVMRNCARAERPDQDDTWITDEMLQNYCDWHLAHRKGEVQSGPHSFEAWQNEQLVGGFYGVSIGGVFFGESMFSAVANASKYALIQGARLLQSHGVQIIDCQMKTEHMSRFGADTIPRSRFLEEIQDTLGAPAPDCAKMVTPD
jgi:leucyl/phenylalanyl-tRNA--protein transferase